MKKAVLFAIVAILCTMKVQAATQSTSLIQANVIIDGIIYDLYADDSEKSRYPLYAVVKGTTITNGNIVVPGSLAMEQENTQGNIYEVRQVADNAFKNNTGIEGVSLPASVTAIGLHVFAGCTRLTSLTHAGNGTYMTVGNAIFNKNGSGTPTTLLYGCTGTVAGDIPASVTAIERYAFEGSGLTSFNIPASITTVGEGAFSGCSLLADITLPSVQNIGAAAFKDCVSLYGITLPSLTTFSNTSTVFQGCVNMHWVDLSECASYQAQTFSRTGANTLFASLNPYCLAYVPNGTTIPADAYNAVVKNGTSYNCKDLRFDDDFGAIIPISFHADEVTNNHAIIRGQLQSVCLPYAPPVREGLEYYQLADKSLTKKSDGTYWATFETVKTPAANRCYMVRATQYQPEGYNTADVTVYRTIGTDTSQLPYVINSQCTMAGTSIALTPDESYEKWMMADDDTWRKVNQISDDTFVHAFTGWIVMPTTVLASTEPLHCELPAPPDYGVVIWCADNKTLYISWEEAPAVGSQWVNEKGETHTVTKMWDGVSVKKASTYDRSPWANDIGSQVQHVVIQSSFYKAFPTSLSGWFYNMYNLTDIEGINYLNTDDATTMKYMFYNCKKLPNVDLSHFKTRRCTNMQYMFYYCEKFDNPDLSTFTTNSVTDMGSMFSWCTGLTLLDLSTFNTAQVTNMGNMFAYNDKLVTIRVSDQWSTEALNPSTGSYNMFKNCKSIMGGYRAKYDDKVIDATKAHAGIGGYLTNGEVVPIGDANGDHAVTITDAVGIVDKILGNPAENFNPDAADINNDGIITITDAVGVVDIILSK